MYNLEIKILRTVPKQIFTVNDMGICVKLLIPSVICGKKAKVVLYLFHTQYVGSQSVKDTEQSKKKKSQFI